MNLKRKKTMIYEINNKYYIKVGKDFVEVEMVINNDDIKLNPTKNKIENNGKIKYKEINILSDKQRLLDEYKKRNSRSERNSEDEETHSRFAR